MKDIKKAIESVKSGLPYIRGTLLKEDVQTLISLAERVENIKGLPEKINQGDIISGVDICSAEYDKVIKYQNQAIDDCTLYIAKQKGLLKLDWEYIRESIDDCLSRESVKVNKRIKGNLFISIKHSILYPKPILAWRRNKNKTTVKELTADGARRR